MFLRLKANFLQRKFFAAENVNVQVRHGLSTVVALVYHYAIAAAQSELGRKRCDFGKCPANHRLVFAFHLAKKFEMAPRYKEVVTLCLGADVPNDEDLVVLVELFGGNFSPFDFAKDTVVHINSPFKPSR